jgi:hypothetical protein
VDAMKHIVFCTGLCIGLLLSLNALGLDAMAVSDADDLVRAISCFDTPSAADVDLDDADDSAVFDRRSPRPVLRAGGSDTAFAVACPEGQAPPYHSRAPPR